MNKIQQFIASRIAKFFMKSLPDMANEWQNKHAPALGAAAKAVVEENVSLYGAISKYFEQTIEDDPDGSQARKQAWIVTDAVIETLRKLVDDLDKTPFLEVLDELPRIVIPDLDEDPENDITLADLLKSIIEAMASDEFQKGE